MFTFCSTHARMFSIQEARTLRGCGEKTVFSISTYITSALAVSCKSARVSSSSTFAPIPSPALVSQVLLSVRSFVDDLQDEPVIKAILAPLPDQNSVASQTDTEGSDSNARALSVTSKNNRQATLKNGGSGASEFYTST